MRALSEISAISLDDEEKMRLLNEIRSIFMKAQEHSSVRLETIYPKLYEMKGILDVFHTAP